MASKRRNKKRVQQQGATSASKLPPPPTPRELTAVPPKLRRIMEFREKEGAKRRKVSEGGEAQSSELAVGESQSQSRPDGLQTPCRPKQEGGSVHHKKENISQKVRDLSASGEGVAGGERSAEEDKSANVASQPSNHGTFLSSTGGSFSAAALAEREEREDGGGAQGEAVTMGEGGGEKEVKDENQKSMGMQGLERGSARGGREGMERRERAENVKKGKEENGVLEEGVTEEVGELGSDSIKRKQRRRRRKIGELRVASLEEGFVTVSKSKLNKKKREFLESKKLKKMMKGKQGADFGSEQPKVQFGDVVSAPPKNLQKPRRKPNKSGVQASATPTLATSAPAAAHHWPESMGIMAASNERLRETAVNNYRNKKNWALRPGSVQLPELQELE